MVNPSKKKKIPIYDSKSSSLFPFQRSTLLCVFCVMMLGTESIFIMRILGVLDAFHLFMQT